MYMYRSYILFYPCPRVISVIHLAITSRLMILFTIRWQMKMALSEIVLLKSTLEIQNKPYSVKLTSSEIYWEVITSSRAVGGPYSEPLVSK